MMINRVFLAIFSAVVLISSTLVPVGFIQKAEAATINITTDTTWTNMTINAGDVVNISQRAILTINGLVSNYGTINLNSGSGLFISQSGTVNINEYGSLNVFQDPDDQFLGELDVSGTLNINAEGQFNINADGFVVILSGGTLNSNHGTLTNVLNGIINISGGTLLNRGTINVHGTLDMNSGGILDMNSGGILNIKGGGRILREANSILNINSGGILNINNDGKLFLNINGILNINSGGILNINSGGTLSLETGGTITNTGIINKQCGGIFTQESGSTFTGNPIVDLCVFPRTHMSDTTASSGTMIAKGGNTIIGERVTSTSQLKGDKIDQITIKLKKSGAPTGNAIIGIFSSTGALKKQFAAKDVTTLTTGFKDYTFKLSGGQLYTIVPGDRIGIKYAGGSAINSISVMRDTNAADPFDGTKTDMQQFKAGVWSGINTNDMYMILKQTHA